MLAKFLRKFLNFESTSGMILFLMASFALILSNSPLAYWYEWFFHTSFKIQLGSIYFNEPFLFWINDGLMSLFFLLIGLELKREFLIGQFKQPNQILLASIAAIGGMVIPALIYILLNWKNVIYLKGWAIPVATDIAFTLGILSLFNRRIPTSLKFFLITLAIFDDLGAIIIIALFYAQEIAWIYLLGVGICLIMLYGLNKMKINALFPYLLLGLLLWFCMLGSGIHPTLSGILLALMLPVYHQYPSPGPLLRLEKGLHPWVAFLIMPLFALANAGVSFLGFSFQALTDGITLGIILGLCLGKPLGIGLTIFLALKTKWVTLPKQVNWRQLLAGAMLCGIGFTMSLFLGTLAFQNDYSMYLSKVRLGVLFGSLFSILLGSSVLSFINYKK